MTAATALAIVRLVLTVVSYFIKAAERAQFEKAVLNEVQLLQKARVDAAAAARDNITPGGMSDDLYRRD